MDIFVILLKRSLELSPLERTVELPKVCIFVLQALLYEVFFSNDQLAIHRVELHVIRAKIFRILFVP
ncbi:unnamed protein product [Pseudo-nitzschia multistriata]|uniref:Uncharacterized protein n=1 Tax=Pseudo-nitzschia multistriata TaxID=183589 RepID=A0A448ZTI8_9STRA|nr:unnamed protein product [Pseudo-nitzschia multistriata]